MNGSRHAQCESCQGWGGAEQAPRQAGNLPGEGPCSRASEHWLQAPGHLACVSRMVATCHTWPPGHCHGASWNCDVL